MLIKPEQKEGNMHHVYFLGGPWNETFKTLNDLSLESFVNGAYKQQKDRKFQPPGQEQFFDCYVWEEAHIATQGSEFHSDI